MDLRTYQVVLLNTSAGKDSLAMLDHVYSVALAQEATGRLQAVHCDLGRMEWAGPRELGMPRLSCALCIFAPKEALLLAGYHNPALLAESTRFSMASPWCRFGRT